MTRTTEKELILDINKLAKNKKFYQVSGVSPSKDNQLLAYAEDINGRREYTIKVKDIKTGLVEIRNDKDGNLSSTIGRKSFSTEKLVENFNHFIESIKKEKPDTIKGEFIKSSYITSTMGISYKVGSR